jgi:hypothetical protein
LRDAFLTQSQEAEMFDGAAEDADVPPAASAKEWSSVRIPTQALVERSRSLLPKMHDEDREEAIELHDRIGTALEAQDAAALEGATSSLEELLFFIEGR